MRRTILPYGLLLLVSVGLLLTGHAPAVDGFAGPYRIGVFAVGGGLSLLFHRSRVFVAVVSLAAWELATPPGPHGTAILLSGSAFGLLLGLLSIMRDRGVLSRMGVLQLSLVVLFVSVPALVPGDGALPPAVADPVPSAVRWLSWSVLPRLPLLIALAGLLLGAYGLYRWRGPVERALLWSQVSLLTGLHVWEAPAALALFLLTIGVLLTVSVLETSYSMAYLDELTGLPGRRALMRDLAGVGGTFTLAMVDVDHFKKFNDKHGHDVGDQVLRLVATRLGKAPGGGKAYRYGGEEFTLLYPGRVREDALPHLEAVRASVEVATFSVRAWNRPRRKPEQAGRKRRSPRKLSVTVSVGVADSTGADPSVEAVLKRADVALYRAKKKGRNQVSR